VLRWENNIKIDQTGYELAQDKSNSELLKTQ